MLMTKGRIFSGMQPSGRFHLGNYMGACGNGLVGVNIMVALKHYKEHVQAAVAAGADVIISGAGPFTYMAKIGDSLLPFLMYFD